MRAKAGILINLCLLFLVGTAAGHIPDTSTITTSNQWVIANSVDQTTITVIVSNSSLGSMQGATVMFSIDNLIYGSMTPSTTISDASGVATSTFKVNKKSGIAVITAKIISHDGEIVNKTVNQSIDHDSPYYPYFAHPLNGTVATDVPFNISITDQWGNRIDNRRGAQAHIINLHVHGPAPDDCKFVGFGHDISPVLDPNGNISVNVTLTTKIGPNNILMDTFGSIPDKLEWINADTNGVPFWISQEYTPLGYPPTIPADGTRFFTIKYILFDKYGNPTNNQYIWVNTSVPGEEHKFVSNNLGQVLLQYGPRSSIGVINITATAISNTTVTLSQTVEFMNTGAEIISLTANPDTMASLDANPSRISDILATVADHSGNAVAGESVNFTIQNITYDSITYNVTAPPLLLSPGSITDVNGVAAVQFRPGSFTTPGNSNYSPSATGHCEVKATWNGTHKIVPVTWKNYPYLSVKTSVNPLTVEINNTIDVTIEFRGDGWALQPRPIDVILLLDQSGSMGSSTDSNSRLYKAKQAASVFVDQMNSSNGDRVGIMTYNQSGWVYQGLTNNLPTAKNKISSITGNTNGAHTNMRQGLHDALKNEAQNANPGSVKAVIHMTDGDWSMAGDPLARQDSIGFDADGPGLHSVWAGNIVNPSIEDVYKYFPDIGGGDFNSGSITNAPNGQTFDAGKTHWNTDQFETTQNRSTRTTTYYTNASTSNQNLSVYAGNNQIRLYSISFVQQPLAQTKNALINMANSTGAFYQHAPDQTKLEALYKQIAEELKDNAGVNTTMTADFENVNVTGVTMPGDQVFDYVYNPTASTKIYWQNGTPTVINQSADWAADNKLDFTIGTIKVGQFWNATFRLKVNQSGLIDVFGKNSTVSFNGGTEILHLPQTFITVVPKLNVTVIGVKTITLTNLTVTEPGEIKALLPVMWNTNYTGNNTLTEKVYYSIDHGPWVLFDIKTHAYNATTTEYVDYAQLDVTKLPPGGYRIMVYATAPDAPDASDVTIVKLVGGKGKTFIKLE
jgi:hypothetical protein